MMACLVTISYFSFFFKVMWGNFVFSFWCFSSISLIVLSFVRYIFGIGLFTPLFSPIICLFFVSTILLMIELSRDC